MKSIKSYFPVFIGIFITLLYLCLNLSTINDYGLTWDFTYHFNSFLWHMKLPLTDPNFVISPSPPISDFMPAISHFFFSEKFKILNFDAAYNLYSVVIGSLGIGILYFAVLELFNWKAALFSTLTLAFLPRYFGHLHNNMKDIPQAVFFAFSMWLFWRLYKSPNVRRLVIAALMFAVSCNSKVNGLFIPIISFAFLFILFLKNKFNLRKAKIKPVILLYFLLAPIFAYILWSFFWVKPLDRIIEASHSYTTSTTNMPILYFGNIVYSGNNVPWHYPLGIIAVTTPLIILIFAFIGLFTIMKNNKFPFENRLFLLLWLFIPLSRYLKPHMIVIDDIRHYMEAILPFAAVAGIGAFKFSEIVYHIKQIKKLVTYPLFLTIFLLIYFSYLGYQIYSYHPFQTSYYNELIGGIKGARGKFDMEFWASAYKRALQYLNKNAPFNAKITIPMAPDIAKLYLRPDLVTKLNELNMAGADGKVYTQSDYTVVLNRESFFGWYGIFPYIENRIPVYSLDLHQIPLVSIYKN